MDHPSIAEQLRLDADWMETFVVHRQDYATNGSRIVDNMRAATDEIERLESELSSK